MSLSGDMLPDDNIRPDQDCRICGFLFATAVGWTWPPLCFYLRLFFSKTFQSDCASERQ